MASADEWGTATELGPARSSTKNRAELLLRQLKSDKIKGSMVIDQCINLWLAEINIRLSNDSRRQLKSSMYMWIELAHARNKYAHNDVASETPSFETLDEVHQMLAELPIAPGLNQEEKEAIRIAIYLWRSRRYQCIEGKWIPNPVSAPAEVVRERAEKRKALKEKKSWKKHLKESSQDKDVDDCESEGG